MSNVSLSYIVPVCNTRDYVLRCLQSLLDQGIPANEFEIIIVDDGSTDGSLAILQAFAQEHRQSVKLLTQGNAGVSAARNAAIEAASGDYVQFVDSDDFLAPGMMASLLQRAVEMNLDAMVFNYQPIAADGNPMPLKHGDEAQSTALMTGVEYLDSHVATPYIWRFLIRREFLNRQQLRFDPSLIVCEDGDLIVRLLLAASRVAHDSSVPYRYVKRDGSAMHNQDKQHLLKRIFSQVDSAASISATIARYEAQQGKPAPKSVAGLRNVYLYFSMTKALTTGLVDSVLPRIIQHALYPFPCVGPEAGYHGMKWRAIHAAMMHPHLWRFLSRVYRLIKS